MSYMLNQFYLRVSKDFVERYNLGLGEELSSDQQNDFIQRLFAEANSVVRNIMSMQAFRTKVNVYMDWQKIDSMDLLLLPESCEWSIVLKRQNKEFELIIVYESVLSEDIETVPIEEVCGTDCLILTPPLLLLTSPESFIRFLIFTNVDRVTLDI